MLHFSLKPAGTLRSCPDVQLSSLLLLFWGLAYHLHKFVWKQNLPYLLFQLGPDQVTFVSTLLSHFCEGKLENDSRCVCLLLKCAGGQRQFRAPLSCRGGHSPSCTAWQLMDFTEKSHQHMVSEVTQLTANELTAPGDNQDLGHQNMSATAFPNFSVSVHRGQALGVNVHPWSTTLWSKVAALAEVSENCIFGLAQLSIPFN